MGQVFGLQEYNAPAPWPNEGEEKCRDEWGLTWPQDLDGVVVLSVVPAECEQQAQRGQGAHAQAFARNPVLGLSLRDWFPRQRRHGPRSRGAEA